VTPTVADNKSRLQWENQTLAKGENYSGGKMSFHTRRENRVRNHTIKGLALAAGALLVAFALSAPANAATLRRGTSGATVTAGSTPGEVFWTYYDTSQTLTTCTSTTTGDCNEGGNGDNIIRLINPNGSANDGIFGESQTFVCAMIYVFDDDEEMGECCGCPISSAGLLTLSVDHNLTSNFEFGNNPDGDSQGAIAIVAAPINLDLLDTVSGTSNGQFCTNSQSAACNFGCDPTTTYTVSTSANLLGSITHNQVVENNFGGSTSGLTEVGLFDDGSGDPNNIAYLQAECASNVGGDSGRAICKCPITSSSP